MNGKGHTAVAIVVIGIGSWVGHYVYDKGLTEFIQFAPAVWIGSFLPDLDAKYSYIRDKLSALAWIYTIVQKCFRKTALNCVFKHRGLLLHSFYTLIPVVGLILVNPRFNTVEIGVLLGLIGHHLADMFTTQGLDYFGLKEVFGRDRRNNNNN